MAAMMRSGLYADVLPSRKPKGPLCTSANFHGRVEFRSPSGVPELKNLLLWGRLETGALMRVEANEIDLALYVLQQIHQAMGVLHCIVHPLKHHILDEHGPLPTPG